MPAGKAILYVPFAKTVAKQDKIVHGSFFYPIVFWFLLRLNHAHYPAVSIARAYFPSRARPFNLQRFRKVF